MAPSLALENRRVLVAGAGGLGGGTVSGVAGFRPDAHDHCLRPGDVVEAEIGRIGILRNRIISWKEAYGVPATPKVVWT